jgi:hypothetical protein
VLMFAAVTEHTLRPDSHLTATWHEQTPCWPTRATLVSQFQVSCGNSKWRVLTRTLESGKESLPRCICSPAQRERCQ